MIWSRLLFCLAVPAALILALDFAGIWVRLGAHPFWSLKGAGIGIAIGLAVLLCLAFLQRYGRVSEALMVLIFAATALVAGTLTLNGRESFVASYANDAEAGRFWYFGYIGFVAALYAALATLCRMIRQTDRI
jgi:hypothetical protein